MVSPVVPVARVFALGPLRVVVELDAPDVELVVAVVAGRTVAAWRDDHGRRLRRVVPGRA
jgi:hypothetical protein